MQKKFNNFIQSYQNRVGPITANKRLENLEIVRVRLSVPVSKQAPKKNNNKTPSPHTHFFQKNKAFAHLKGEAKT